MPITELDNEELVKLIKEGSDPDGCCMMQLWKKNQVLIRKTAEKYKRFDDMQDLMQEAFIGFRKAVEEYDPEYETKFISYALIWVKGEISRYVRKNGSIIRFPSYIIGQLNMKRKFIQEYRCRFGHDPSDKQIASALGITIKQLEDLDQKVSSCRNLSSLDKPISDDEDLKLEDCLTDGKIPQEEIEEQIYSEQRAEAVWHEVDQLPERQKQVIKMRYQEDLTLEECAAILGINSNAVRAHQINGVRTLGSGKHRKMLIYFSEDPYSRAFGGGLNSFRVTQTSITERLAINNIDRHRNALSRITAFIQGREEEVETGRKES